MSLQKRQPDRKMTNAVSGNHCRNLMHCNNECGLVIGQVLTQVRQFTKRVTEPHIKHFKLLLVVCSLISEGSDPRKQRQSSQGQGQEPSKTAAQVSQTDREPDLNSPENQMVELIL